MDLFGKKAKNEARNWKKLYQDEHYDLKLANDKIRVLLKDLEELIFQAEERDKEIKALHDEIRGQKNKVRKAVIIEKSKALVDTKADELYEQLKANDEKKAKKKKVANKK